MTKRTVNALISTLFAMICALCTPAALAVGLADETPSNGDAFGEYDEILDEIANHGAARVIVRLRTDSSFSGAQGASSRSLRGAGHVQAQNAVLARVPAHIGAPARKFQNFPMVAMEVDEATLDELLEMGEVADVTIDRLVAPSLIDSTAVIGAPSAWSSGITGSGQMVAVLDSGVDTSHSYFADKTIVEACFSTSSPFSGATSTCPNGQQEQFGAGAAASCGANVSGCDHGTHVAGIAVGNGSASNGVAPGADLLAIQIFSRFDNPAICGGAASCVLAYYSDIVAGLDYVYSLRNSYNIASVNMSLGGGSYSSVSACDGDSSLTSTKAAIEQLRSAGIATVIAAGNSGNDFGMAAPGCLSAAISVGATSKNDLFASYSNTASWTTVLAPGSSIYAPVPGGGRASKSGTSMAAPHVAGALAVLKEQAELEGFDGLDVNQMIAAITSTGTPLTNSDNGFTFPRLQLDQAVQAIAAGTALPNIIIVDSHSSGSAVDGSFTGFSDTQAYGGAARKGDDQGVDRFEFNVSLPEDGFYRVSAWWPDDSAGDTNTDAAQVTISDDFSAAAVTVNQQQNGGRWNEFGVYYLSASANPQIQISEVTPTENVLVADAFRLELVDASSVGPLTITTETLVRGYVDSDYSETITASGGVQPLSWSVTAGSLPSGLSLDGSTGEISGVPTASGIFDFAVEVIDDDGDSAERAFSITIENAPIVLLDAAFSSNLADWTIVDGAGANNGPSSWSVSNDAAVQTSDISVPDPATLSVRGTYAAYDGGYGWSNYRVSVDMSSSDDDFVGIMFRVSDDDNYYRFWWTAQGQLQRLDKTVDGVTTVLDEHSGVAYQPGQTYAVEILADGATLEVLIDGATVFSVQDADLATGSMALYSRANNGGRYANLLVADQNDGNNQQVNQAPQIDALSVPDTIMDDSVADFSVTANDPDGDNATLSYTWSVSPAQGTLSNADSLTATYTPLDLTDSRDYTVTVVVTDAEGATTESSATLTVEDADTPQFLLDENFSSGNLAGWTIVDGAGANHGPSSWSVTSGAALQTSDISVPDPAVLSVRGTYAVYDGGYTWSDYRASFDMTSTDNDYVGIMFRVSDDDNYYRFWWTAQGQLQRLDKTVGGVTTVLGEHSGIAYQPGQTYAVEILADGATLEVLIDGTTVFSVQDANLTTGSVALFSRANNGSRFDDILVVDQNGGADLPVNEPPQIDALSVPSLAQDNATVDFSVTASDPDGDDANLSYAWSIGPNEGTLNNASTATPTYIPLDLDTSRDYVVTVVVTDDQGATAETSATLTVEDADVPLVLLDENFSSGSLADWTIVDDAGANNGPSLWSAASGEAAQTTDVSVPDPQTLSVRGTYAVYEAGYAWSDYRATLDMTSDDDDYVGIMFRVSDDDNYYRFWWTAQGQRQRLDKTVNGVTTVLAEHNGVVYQTGQTYAVEIVAEGTTLEVRVDGVTVFSVQDADLSAGSVALYSRANNGSRYDNLWVEGN